MRNTYKIHLRSGTTIMLKADDFKIKYNNAGEVTQWEAPNASRWVVFMPSDLVAVERVR